MKKRGQVLVEFVISFPILLLVFLAGLELARLYVRQMELNFAAYMGARVAEVYDGSDSAIVYNHINSRDNASIYRFIRGDRIKYKIVQDGDVKYVILKKKMQPLTPFLDWGDSIVLVAVAPFMEEFHDTNPTYYKIGNAVGNASNPVITKYLFTSRDNFVEFARKEAQLGANRLSFLPKRWYPSKVITSSYLYLAAQLGLIDPTLGAFVNPFTRGIAVTDIYTIKAMVSLGSAGLMGAIGQARYNRITPLTRTFTGFLLGYGKVGYTGFGVSPKPPRCWDSPWCGPDGHYYASASNGWWWEDAAGSYYAFAISPCVRKVIVCGWHGCHCVWCLKHRWTPVTHFVNVHAGGSMWEHKGKYWNFYNYIWATVLVPELYATGVYHSDYTNIKSDCWHNGCWMGKPSYAPDRVTGWGGHKRYLSKLERSRPKDEQRYCGWMGDERH